MSKNSSAISSNTSTEPFEMASMCVELDYTRYCSANLASPILLISRFSQRYAVEAEINVPDLRRQDVNRQNSIDDLPEEKVEFLQ